ncbi:hypothetical protein [Pseudodesulfovibrio sp.]|uniref:hypothetical protein n=1 Tax=unclassified Pseudodesulfovibrio TaxID=2661612 RepID=UPI003AFFFD5B
MELIPPLEDEQVSEACKAFRHPARLAIFRHLLTENRCACGRIFEIVAFLLSGFGPDIFSLGEAWRRGLAVPLSSILGILSGTVAVPIALPALRFHHFFLKGAATGAICGLLNLTVGSTPSELIALWL